VKVASRIYDRAMVALLGVLVVGYLLQLATPLRINTDSYRLLSMAVSAAEGHGFVVDGRPDQFPVGYPLVVLGLLKARLANSTTLVFVNLLALASAMILVWQLVARAGFDVRYRLVVVLATLSSWVVIKHVSIPLSDLPYLGVSIASLACLQMFWGRKGPAKWPWFVGGILIAVAAALIRTIGLALMPAFALSLLLHEDHRSLLRQGPRRPPAGALLMSAVAVVLLGIVVLLAISRTQWFQGQFFREGSYFSNLIEALKQDEIVAVGVQNVRYRLLEFGEVFVNLPITRAPQLSGLLYLAGSVAWVTVLAGCLLAFNRWMPVTLYFLSYCLLMLCWPYYGSRFWLPVVPLLAIFTVEAARSIGKDHRTLRWASGSYFALFLALGIVALGFSTRISLSGREFSETFGDGDNRMTYRYALDNGKPVDIREVDARKVGLLAIFEPRVPERIRVSAELTPTTPSRP
jgi:hypothetical protein